MMPAHLELGLHEGDSRPSARGAEGRRDYLLYGDKRDVDGDDIGLLSYLLRREETGVDVLEEHDPRIRPQLLVELVGAYIDCVHLDRACLEQEIDKTSGGRAYVDRSSSTHIQPEFPDGLFELNSP